MREEVKRIRSNNAAAFDDADDQIVYVTRTGAKYHRENCRYLRKSEIPMNPQDAFAAEYKPYKICRPPS